MVKRNLKPLIPLEEAVQNGNIEQVNRHLFGQGFILEQYPSSIVVMDEGHNTLFRVRNVKLAMKKIRASGVSIVPRESRDHGNHRTTKI
jgi:hypothetical protein